MSRLQRSTTTGKVMEELERETLKDTYMSSLGYGLVIMWEDQWGRKVGSSRDIKAFLAVFSTVCIMCSSPPLLGLPLLSATFAVDGF